MKKNGYIRDQNGHPKGQAGRTYRNTAKKLTAAIVVTALAFLLAVSVVHDTNADTDTIIGADTGSISELRDEMMNATEDIELTLTSDLVSDLLLIGGDSAITIDHDFNITIIGGDPLVTKAGTLHFNIINNGAGTIRFENVIIQNSGANSGGMRLEGGNYEFANCEFSGLTRTAVVFAGAHNDASFISCTFENNTSRAVTLAQGDLSDRAEYSFIDCLFLGNTVTNSGGGAIRITGSHFTLDIDGCAFIENKAIGTGTGSGSNNTVDGGALYVSTDWATGGVLNIYDSYFEKNFAQDDGGAVIVIGAKYYTGIASSIVNSTFYGNTVAGAHYGKTLFGFPIWCTDGSGGAINYFGLTESEITHCTFYDNGITNKLPDGVTGSNWGSVGGGGAIAVDTGEDIKTNDELPSMPKLTNNIFVGNYVSNPMSQSLINTIGLFGDIKERSKTGNVFVLPMCDRDFQGVPFGTDPRMLQNNGNIGYDNGNWDTYGNSKPNGYTNNGINLAAGIQVKNIFANYNNTAKDGDPNTAIPTEYGDPVGAAGSAVFRKCFIPSPTSNELYRDGSTPYVNEVPYDTLGNMRDTFPNAGAVEIYWTMFNPGAGAGWTDAVPSEVVNPDNPSETFLVIKSQAFATNNSYYVMTATGIPGDPSGILNAMPRSAIEHSSPDYGFMGWRSSIPDLDWSGYAAWAYDNGHTELTVEEFLSTHPLSDLPDEAFPLYQPGDVIRSEKQTLTAEWSLDEYRVDFHLNYAVDPVWYSSAEPGREAPRINIVTGSTITAPLDPYRSTYLFLSWYKDASCTDAWDFDSDIVTEDIILYAKWDLDPEAWALVTFESNGGSYVAPLYVVKGSTIAEPAPPVRTTYIFGGWFTDDVTFANAFIFDADTVDGDITLYAKWDHDPNDWWMVTFEPNNGDDEWYAWVLKGDPVDEPSVPVKTKLTFDAWYLGVIKWDFDDGVDDNITLTASYNATVTLISTADASFEYTVDDWATTEGTFDIPAKGSYTITMPEGTAFEIKVVSEHEGCEITWNDSIIIQNGTLYANTADVSIEVTVTFISDDGAPSSWMWMLIVFAGLLFLLIFLDDDDDEIFGKVTKNGEGLASVTISYVTDGITRTVTTDNDGDYSIPTEKGKDVIITDIRAEGHTFDVITKDGIACSLPASIRTEKERTRVNIMMQNE